MIFLLIPQLGTTQYSLGQLAKYLSRCLSRIRHFLTIIPATNTAVADLRADSPSCLAPASLLIKFCIRRFKLEMTGDLYNFLHLELFE